MPALTPYAPSTHVLLDFYAAQWMTEPAAIARILHEAAAAAGATVLQAHVHHFGEGHGVTGVLLLAESHISIHTWPELNYMALDVFMCGSAQVQQCVDVLTHQFKPQHTRIHHICRGQDVF